MRDGFFLFSPPFLFSSRPDASADDRPKTRPTVLWAALFSELINPWGKLLRGAVSARVIGEKKFLRRTPADKELSPNIVRYRVRWSVSGGAKSVDRARFTDTRGNNFFFYFNAINFNELLGVFLLGRHVRFYPEDVQRAESSRMFITNSRRFDFY